MTGRSSQCSRPPPRTAASASRSGSTARRSTTPIPLLSWRRRVLDRPVWNAIVAANPLSPWRPPVSVTGNDTLKTRRTLIVDGKSYDYFSADAAAKAAGLGDVSRLPFSLKVLLENLVRLENGRTVTLDDIQALGLWLCGESPG